MRAYIQLLREVLSEGKAGPDRTNKGTLSSFGKFLELNLREGFPAVTTKKLYFDQVAAELSCFIHGYDMLSQFEANGCKIWRANCDADYWRANSNYRSGWLGRIYGVNWRAWLGPDGQIIDQLSALLKGLQEDPRGRRHLVTAWDPAGLDKVSLPACHTHFQLYIDPVNGDLSCIVYMRSVDLFLGLPFDIASYALLTHLIARDLGRGVGWLKFALCDAHIYLNHIAQASEQVERAPMPLPELQLGITSTLDFAPGDTFLVNYIHHSPIKADMNV